MVKVIASEAEFDQLVLQADASVVCVVDFTASWCGPCRMIAPYFEQLENEYKVKGVRFFKVDVDQLQGVARRFQVTAMPTFSVFVVGQVRESMRGANQAGLEALVRKYAPTYPPGGQRLGGGDAGESANGAGASSRTERVGGSDAAQRMFVEQLVQMGFDKRLAHRAVLHTKSRSIGDAVDWITTHMDDDDEDDEGDNDDKGNDTDPVGSTDAPDDPSAKDDQSTGSVSAANADDGKEPNTAEKDKVEAQQKDSGSVAATIGGGGGSSSSSSSSSSSNPTAAENTIVREDVISDEDAAAIAAALAEDQQQPTKKLTKEEIDQKKRELQAKAAQARAQREKELEKSTIMSEKQRIEMGKLAQKTRKEMERKQREKEELAAKRERIAEKKAREKIRKQIEADKRERRAKREAAARAARGEAEPASPSPSASGAVKMVSAAANADEAVIRFKLPSGKSVQQTFKSSATVLECQEWLAESSGEMAPGSLFHLATGFPRSEYTFAKAKSTTLKDADQVPRGSFFVRMD